MISEHLPSGTQVVALRSGHGIEAGRVYTLRGFVLNRHWRTREPDPHALFWEIEFPRGKRGPIGFPRDAFSLPVPAPERLRSPEMVA